MSLRLRLRLSTSKLKPKPKLKLKLKSSTNSHAINCTSQAQPQTHRTSFTALSSGKDFPIQAQSSIFAGYLRKPFPNMNLSCSSNSIQIWKLQHSYKECWPLITKDYKYHQNKTRVPAHPRHPAPIYTSKNLSLAVSMSPHFGTVKLSPPSSKINVGAYNN